MVDICQLFCCSGNPQVTSINVFAGAVIYQIKFTFSDESVECYGERGGFRRQPFTIDPGDYLSEVIISQDDRSILGVQFATTSGRTSPIYGRSSPKASRSCRAPEGTRGGIVGLILEKDVVTGFLACNANGEVKQHILPRPPTVSVDKDADEYAPAMKTGFLTKESDYLKNMNRRFVVLHDGFLMYYLDEKKEPPYGETLRGKFDLTMYQIRKEDDEHKTILLTLEPKPNMDGMDGELPKQRRASILDFSSDANPHICQFQCKNHAEREVWKKEIIKHSARRL